MKVLLHPHDLLFQQADPQVEAADGDQDEEFRIRVRLSTKVKFSVTSDRRT